jgi:hypothetical protein
LLGPLERANLIQVIEDGRLRLALSKGPNRSGVSPHLRMETDPVSETSCFSSNYLESGRGTKPETQVNLCVIHHRQNHIEFNYSLYNLYFRPM